MPVRIVVYPGDVHVSGVQAELSVARSLRELRTELEGEEPAALVLDLESGGHGALDLLRERRARGSTVPVLVLAPHGDAEAAERCRALGLCTLLSRESATRAVVVAALAELLELAAAKPTDASRAPAMLFKTDSHGGFTHFTRRLLALARHARAGSARTRLVRAHPPRGPRSVGGGVRGRPRRAGRARRRTCACARPTARTAACASRRGPRSTRRRRSPASSAPLFEIDDLVRARDGARADVARLELVNRELEELAFAGAHDLQEPLRSLERALQGAVAGESADLALALRQVGRMRELLRDLVDYAGSGTLHVAVETTDLAQALDWALENLRPAIAESGAEIKVEALARVLADPIQIARVFQNLVSNALRFRGGESPVVSVGAEPRERDVLVYVRDNGIGIPEAHHETIFRVFERLHGGERPGTGMGLAICRRILERHGGRIWVESAPGAGATFYLTLPRAGD